MQTGRSVAAVNDRVGEYVLEQKVGAGAFGEVWRARHHVWSERVVAIKVPTDPEYVRALQTEGAAVHGLEHPNIVRAINFDPYSTPAYLAMEYVEGTSLRPLVGQLNWRESAQVMSHVLAGLSYAHSQGMIHRDLKPENILVSARARSEGFVTPSHVKLTDFGLGKRVTAAVRDSIVYTMSIQKGGAGLGGELAGTIAYMSPEQRSGSAELDARSDLFSCGVILFELLTGSRPAGTELPSELKPDLPRSFDEVFRQAYARLEVRYPSADAFLADLRRAAELEAAPAGRKGPPPLPSVPIPGGKVTGSATCGKCTRPIAAGDQFCMHCGVQLVDKVVRCLCGAYPHPDDVYCMVCGRGIERVR